MKRMLTTFAILLAILLSLFLYQIYKPENPLTNDLASPSQEKRDAAAKILRVTAKPPSKLKWLFFTWHLKKGESQTNFLALLRSYNLSTQPETGISSIGAYMEYRLDDYWLLGCDFGDNYGWFLGDWKFVSRWRAVAVWPVTNFTGVWINYYANGQKFTEGCYTNGSRSGEVIDFYPDGSKMSVWHYANGKANGLGTQYFPSGKIKYQCLYSNYEKIGTEVNYNEDGTTNSIVDHSHQ